MKKEKQDYYDEILIVIFFGSLRNLKAFYKAYSIHTFD